MRAVHSGQPLRRNTKEPLRASASFGGRIALERLHVTFGFQTVESGIHSTDGYVPSNTRVNLLPDRDSIGLLVQPDECQENNVFELAQVIATKHYLYIIE